MAVKSWRQVTLVFAKAPVAGAVKTRLIPLLGKEQAARLHAAMVTHSVALATQYKNHDIQLWCAPETTHPFFNQLQQIYPLILRGQKGENLGQRMHYAFKQALKHYDAAVVIGTDCPALSAELLAQAYQKLQTENEAVIAPAEDGGYVLLGLKRAALQLFAGIAWGTDQVYEQTQIKLQQLQLAWSSLKMQWDVDRPDDLQKLVILANQTDLHPDLRTVIHRLKPITA